MKTKFAKLIEKSKIYNMREFKYECNKCNSNDIKIVLSEDDIHMLESNGMLIHTHDGIEDDAPKLLNFFNERMAEYGELSDQERFEVFVDTFFKFIAIQEFFKDQIEDFSNWFNEIYEKVSEIEKDDEEEAGHV